MAYQLFNGQLDDEESPGYALFTGELDTGKRELPKAPAPVAARQAREDEPVIDYTDAMGNMQGGASVPYGVAPAPVSKSVFDKPLPVEDRSRTPGFLLRPEYVTELRNSFANVPPEQRRTALIEVAKGTDARARAAQQVLADVVAEDKAREIPALMNKRTIDLFANAPPGQPAPRKSGGQPATPQPVAFPDVSPTLLDLVDQKPEAERIAQALRRDEVTRGVVGADTSLEAMADRANRASRDFAAEAFAKENPILGALRSGSAQQVAGMANAIPLITDFAIQMFDKNAERVETPGFVQDLMRLSRSSMPEAGQQNMSEAWDKGEFGTWLGLNFVAQAPQIANQFVAAVVPASRPFILPAMGLQSAGTSFAQGDSSLAAVLKGGAEIAGEKVTLGLFDRSMTALSKLPLSLQAPTVQAVGQKLATAGVAVTAQTIGGALEETATQILQNGVDRFVEGKEVGLLDRVADAAVLGAAMSGPLAIPQTARAFQGGADAFGKAFEQDIAGTTFDRGVNDLFARRALDVQSYDDNIISPTQTAKIAQAQQDLGQASSAADAVAAAENLAGSVDELLVPGTAITPLPRIEPTLTGDLLPVPGRIEPTLTGDLLAPIPRRAEPIPGVDLPPVNAQVEQQFGLDKLRLNAPRPQRIQGEPVANLTDDQLTTIAGDETVPAITRRSAAIEITARQAE